MCTLGFRGMGYSPSFVKNFKKIKAQLVENPETILQVQEATDSICGPCPHNQGDGSCKTQDKIQRLDDQHKAALHLTAGQKLSWNEALQRIKTHMTVEKFHIACESCAWKSHGICETALQDLLKSRHV